MVAIEAFTGYLILSLLAPASVAILDPRRDLSAREEDR